MFVIYNKSTTIILKARARSVGCYVTSYKTLSAAKAALTRLTRAGRLGRTDNRVNLKEDFAIISIDEFNAIDKKVTRINAMTGEAFKESVNANFATSPSSESYWCS